MSVKAGMMTKQKSGNKSPPTNYLFSYSVFTYSLLNIFQNICTFVNYMQIATIITDWENNFYPATLKARLLAAVPQLSIIDISHSIQSFNTLQAAFMLRHSYTHFPQGSIHLIGVNSEPSPTNKLIIVKADGHFFVAPNDGLLSLALDTAPETAIEMEIPRGSTGFKSLESFVRAVQVITTDTIETAGKEVALQKSLLNRPTYDDKHISGQIAYIDSFGNVITNIDKQLFETAYRGRRFEIYLQSNHNKLTKLSNYYDEVASGELVALFNSLHLLEIAVYQGNLAQLERLDTTSSVRIKFL